MSFLSTRPTFVGVSREPVYSPGKVEADRAVLEETARACEERGALVRLLTPDAAPEAFAGSHLVFAMCQGPRALQTLRLLSGAGVPVIHEAPAIESCHRTRMLPLLSRAGVPRPQARMVTSGDPEPDALAWVAARRGAGVWIKRGDVHATQAGDVICVQDEGAARDALAHLAERGVTSAVLEAHVPGRTLKFYGVRGTGFFRAFEEDGSEAWPTPDGLAVLSDRAAAALDLAVYGGDFVVDGTGRTVVVDMNDWPSFGRCRADAAPAIADHLFSRLAESPAMRAPSSPCARSPL